MKIVHLSAECYPIAKVGGLADVVGALPKYQSSKTITSEVIMPLYDNKFIQNHSFKTVYKSTLKLGDEILNFEIQKIKHSHFICSVCSNIECIHEKLDFNLQGYQVDNIIIKGICPNCLK